MANIYIVEDDTNIQEIEAIALKNSGHSVEQFDDAAHFYKKLEEKLPDLAILDLMLPDEEASPESCHKEAAGYHGNCKNFRD